MDIIGRALTVPPPPEKVEAVKEILGSDGILDDRSHAFFLSVLEAGGLFWDPLAPKQTAREIARQAKAAALGQETEEWVESLKRLAWPESRQFRERWVTSLTHQTIRGKQIIPIGPHKRRRPEPEVTYAIQLMDRHLKETTRISAKARRECIAGVLLAIQGSSAGVDDFDPDTGVTPREARSDAIRRRLERAPRPLSDFAYKLVCWRADVKHDPETPYPFCQRFPVELKPGSDGQILVIPFRSPLGVSLERFLPVLDRVIRIRRKAGKLLKPEILEIEINPQGTLRRVIRIPALPRGPWSKEETIWPERQSTDPRARLGGESVRRRRRTAS